MKKLGLFVFALVLLFPATGCEVTTDPHPSATPSPITSVTPSSSPSASPTTTTALDLKGVIGETVGQTWLSTYSGAVPSGLNAYLILQVKTLMPSFKGALPGFYEDPLQPVVTMEMGQRYWIEAKLTAVGKVCGSFFCLTTKAGPMKTMPFYAELGLSQIGAAHGFPDEGQFQTQRFAMAMKYRKLMRDNGVEPMKQYYLPLPALTSDGKKLNLDYKQFDGVPGLTFREMVLDDAIAPPMIIGPNNTSFEPLTVGAKLSWQNYGWCVTSAQIDAAAIVTQEMATCRANSAANYIAAVKASKLAGDLPAGSWIYAWDEGEPTLDARALAQAKRLKDTGLEIMETRNVTEPFKPYVTQFYPVMLFVKPEWVPFMGGSYEACMAQGNCANATDISQVNPPNGDPMFVLDAPAAHPRAFAWVLHKLGAQRGLYYMADLRLATAWQAGGQYNEGGNGDGTFLYPGKDGNPWPSLRLKRLYRGLQDVWYLNHGGTNLVTTSKVWPALEDTYEAERIRVWNSLP